MSDYRVTTVGSINQVRCDLSTYNKADPTATAMVTGATLKGTVIARALAWPSYGCSRYRITLGFETYYGHNIQEEESTVRKAIYFQLSNSTVNATNQWDGPAIVSNSTGGYAGDYVFSTFNLPVAASGGDASEGAGLSYHSERYWTHGGRLNSWVLRTTTTPVSSSRWLSPTSTISVASAVNPFQVWVWAFSESTADYISPTYVAIEEVPLTYDEFP
jgi:hypothetical protein